MPSNACRVSYECTGVRLDTATQTRARPEQWRGATNPVCTENLNPDVVVMKSAKDCA